MAGGFLLFTSEESEVIIMSTTIDNLQIKIETSSETGAAGIRDLASALGELKKNGSLGTVVKNLLFPIPLSKNGCDISEAEGGGCASCGGLKSACERADESFFVNRFANPL